MLSLPLVFLSVAFIFLALTFILLPLSLSVLIPVDNEGKSTWNSSTGCHSLSGLYVPLPLVFDPQLLPFALLYFFLPMQVNEGFQGGCQWRAVTIGQWRRGGLRELSLLIKR